MLIELLCLQQLLLKTSLCLCLCVFVLVDVELTEELKIEPHRQRL